MQHYWTPSLCELVVVSLVIFFYSFNLYLYLSPLSFSFVFHLLPPRYTRTETWRLFFQLLSRCLGVAQDTFFVRRFLTSCDPLPLWFDLSVHPWNPSSTPALSAPHHERIKLLWKGHPVTSSQTPVIKHVFLFVFCSFLLYPLFPFFFTLPPTSAFG